MIRLLRVVYGNGINKFFSITVDNSSSNDMAISEDLEIGIHLS